MDTETLETPEILAIEDRLADNFAEFERLKADWARAWQRAMQRRAMARKRTDQAAQNGCTQLPLDAA